MKGNDESQNNSKWNLRELEDWFRKSGLDWAPVLRDIKDVIVKTLIAVETHIVNSTLHHTKHKSVCYELYGFDVLIDANMKPWLLEVNVAPSLSSSSKLDKIIKTSLLCDIFTLIGIVPLNRK